MNGNRSLWDFKKSLLLHASACWLLAVTLVERTQKEAHTFFALFQIYHLFFHFLRSLFSNFSTSYHLCELEAVHFDINFFHIWELPVHHTSTTNCTVLCLYLADANPYLASLMNSLPKTTKTSDATVSDERSNTMISTTIIKKRKPYAFATPSITAASSMDISAKARRVSTGFTTAKGGSISISAASMQRASTFLGRETDTTCAVEPVQHSSSRVRFNMSDEQSNQTASRQIEAMSSTVHTPMMMSRQPADDANMRLSKFKTAKGSSVQISAQSLNRAESFMQKASSDDSGASRLSSSVNTPMVGPAQTTSSRGILLCDTTTGGTNLLQSKFKTAKGSSVQISAQSLNRAESFIQDSAGARVTMQASTPQGSPPATATATATRDSNTSKRLSKAIGAMLSGTHATTPSFSYSLSQMSQLSQDSGAGGGADSVDSSYVFSTTRSGGGEVMSEGVAVPFPPLARRDDACTAVALGPDPGPDAAVLTDTRKRQLEGYASSGSGASIARRQKTSTTDGSNAVAAASGNPTPFRQTLEHQPIDHYRQQSLSPIYLEVIAPTPPNDKLDSATTSVVSTAATGSVQSTPPRPRSYTAASTAAAAAAATRAVGEEDVVLDTEERVKQRTRSWGGSSDSVPPSQLQHQYQDQGQIQLPLYTTETSPSERHIEGLTSCISTPLLKSSKSQSPGESSRSQELHVVARQLSRQEEDRHTTHMDRDVVDETGGDRVDTYTLKVMSAALGPSGVARQSIMEPSVSNQVHTPVQNTNMNVLNVHGEGSASSLLLLPTITEETNHDHDQRAAVTAAVTSSPRDPAVYPLPLAPVAVDYNSLYGGDSDHSAECHDLTLNKLCIENNRRKRLFFLRQLNSSNLLSLEINSTSSFAGMCLTPQGWDSGCFEEIRLPLVAPEGGESQLLLSVLSNLSAAPLSREMKEWVTMQLLWVLWTLVAYERTYPEEYLGRLVTREQVLEAVAHRFRQYTGGGTGPASLHSVADDEDEEEDKEVEGRRAEFRVMKNGPIKRPRQKFKDTTGSGSMSPLQRCVDIHNLVFPVVLCVVMPPPSSSSSARGGAPGSITLTDGWWWVQAKVDTDINSRLIQTGKLQEGDKIVVFAATFEETDEALRLGAGSTGLEISGHNGRTVMKLYYNGVRKAKHDAKVMT